MKRLFFLALLLLPGLAAATNARLSSADLLEIRAVIHRQLDAFRNDDATSAFELAAPSVQQTFRTPERFMRVVRMAYWAMVRPMKVSFLEMMVLETQAVVQQLQVIDRSGTVWLAYYAMERQQDGSWRASGCHLVQPRTVSASLALQ
jgi:hypothetical protein